MNGNGLPTGWCIGRIGDLVGSGGVFSDGDWVESKDQDPSGEVRLIQLADVGDGKYRNRSARFLTKGKSIELRCTYLAPGDVLIARMPDPLGRACLFPGDDKTVVTVVDVCIVRTNVSEIDHRWLTHFINSSEFRRRVAALQKGTTRRRISRKNLGIIELPIPPSSEQGRIADKLDELFTDLDAGVAALERVKRNLERYRASVLKAAVEGRLTEDWRSRDPDVEPASELLKRILVERRDHWEQDELAKYEAKGKKPSTGWQAKYKEPVEPDTAELPDLPEGWCWATMDQLIVRGPQNGLYKPKTAYGLGIPIIRIDDFQSNWHRSRDDLLLVRVSSQEAKCYGLRLDDLVLNRVNSMSHLGKLLVVPNSLCPALFESNMMRMTLTTLVVRQWVGLYLRSDAGRERLIVRAKQAVNQASINQKDVALTPIPIPPTIEQGLIVPCVEARASDAGFVTHHIDLTLTRSLRLRQAILKRAFEGKLVPQDPNDEPASVLLERIAEQRARDAKTAKKGKKKATSKKRPGRMNVGKSKSVVQEQLFG